MPWRIVVQPNGRYARFSTVVDNFTHYNMNREEAIEVCREELAAFDAEQKCLQAERDPQRFEREIDTIAIVHGEEEKARVLKELAMAAEEVNSPDQRAIEEGRFLEKLARLAVQYEKEHNEIPIGLMVKLDSFWWWDGEKFVRAVEENPSL